MTEYQLDKVDRRVFVHVTFLKVGEINTPKECFEADVLLRTKWREPTLDLSRNQHIAHDKEPDLTYCWKPQVYIDNIIGEPKRTTSMRCEYDAQGRAYVVKRTRVKGSFLENMELWDFPFDIQDLSVTLMSERSDEEVELLDDPEELHKIYRQSFIDEQEWYLYKYTESLQAEVVKDQADPSEIRSALTVRCRSARRPHYFIWNSFSITFMICCLSLITFSVKPILPQNRLQLTFTLVLTTVAFKFIINQTLPKISYLSYLDRYVLATLVCLGLVCIWHGIVSTIADEFKVATDWADHVALVVFGCGYILYNIIFVSMIIRKPYRSRMKMKEKEEAYIALVHEQAERRALRSNPVKPMASHYSPSTHGHVNLAMVPENPSQV